MWVFKFAGKLGSVAEKVTPTLWKDRTAFTLRVKQSDGSVTSRKTWTWLPEHRILQVATPSSAVFPPEGSAEKGQVINVTLTQQATQYLMINFIHNIQ